MRPFRHSWLEFVARAGGAFAGRLRARPIASVDDLSVFVGQRSSLVAQTTLYGYLKTRMGTKFVRYFEDEVFSAGIKEAAVRQFLSCASDLSHPRGGGRRRRRPARA